MLNISYDLGLIVPKVMLRDALVSLHALGIVEYSGDCDLLLTQRVLSGG